MSLRDLIRRSVGLAPQSKPKGKHSKMGYVSEPKRATRGKLRRVNGTVNRRQSGRKPYSRQKVAAILRHRDAQAAGIVVTRSGGLLGAPRMTLTPRAAVRRSLGLQLNPEAIRTGFRVRDAIAIESAKHAPAGGVAMAAAARSERGPAAADPLPGFVDPMGMRWVSRAAYEAMNQPQPPGVPVPFDPSQSWGTR